MQLGKNYIEQHSLNPFLGLIQNFRKEQKWFQSLFTAGYLRQNLWMIGNASSRVSFLLRLSSHLWEKFLRYLPSISCLCLSSIPFPTSIWICLKNLHKLSVVSAFMNSNSNEIKSTVWWHKKMCVTMARGCAW